MTMTIKIPEDKAVDRSCAGWEAHLRRCSPPLKGHQSNFPLNIFRNQEQVIGNCYALSIAQTVPLTFRQKKEPDLRFFFFSQCSLTALLFTASTINRTFAFQHDLQPCDVLHQDHLQIADDVSRRTCLPAATIEIYLWHRESESPDQ